jgi:ABC-2 type transport system ATP-binding protein
LLTGRTGADAPWGAGWADDVSLLRLRPDHEGTPLVTAIQVEDLRKSYRGVPAVRGISFRVAEGEVFALLGPNGAGKTTTVEILEGFRTRDSGSVEVFGRDPGKGERAYRERIGVVLQDTTVDRFLTVAETVELLGQGYPSPLPVGEALSLVGLSEQRNTRVGKLSGGQRRRLDMAVGLAGDPELLFLDEPTTGFDPSARAEAWTTIQGLAARGTTILLTTHYMEEAERLANRVVIMTGGRVAAEGAPEELRNRTRTLTTVTFRLPAHAPQPPLGIKREDGAFELRVDDATVALHSLTAWAVAAGLRLGDLEVTRASLEDVYLELTRSAEQEATRR